MEDKGTESKAALNKHTGLVQYVFSYMISHLELPASFLQHCKNPLSGKCWWQFCGNSCFPFPLWPCGTHTFFSIVFHWVIRETPQSNLTPFFFPFFTESLDSGVKMVESTPLRDRMAMYQAAVTKHDFPSSPTVSDNPLHPLHHEHSLSYYHSLWFHHMQMISLSADMTLFAYGLKG